MYLGQIQAEETIDGLSVLTNCDYFGRMIFVAVPPQGDRCFIGGAISGRSEGSRNRMVRDARNGYAVEVADPNKMQGDPALTIYQAMDSHDQEAVHVASNGHQTDSILEHIQLVRRGLAEMALQDQSYEPDAPNFTPRITAVLTPLDEIKLAISIIRRAENSEEAKRRIFTLNQLTPSFGQLVTTYTGNALAGQPLPSFRGDPLSFRVSTNDFETFMELLAKKITEGAGREYWVAIYGMEVDLNTGQQTELWAKNRYDRI